MSSPKQKLARLKEQFGDDVPPIIPQLEKDVKKAELIAKLLQFEGMNLFLDMLETKLKGINYELQENANLDDASRASLFASKTAFRQVIKFFTDQEKVIEGIDEWAKKELEE